MGADAVGIDPRAVVDRDIDPWDDKPVPLDPGFRGDSHVAHKAVVARNAKFVALREAPSPDNARSSRLDNLPQATSIDGIELRVFAVVPASPMSIGSMTRAGPIKSRR